jgi:hypothetical protein
MPQRHWRLNWLNFLIRGENDAGKKSPAAALIAG